MAFVNNWNKTRRLYELVRAAPLAADKRISLLRFVSAHGWKSQLKCMRQDASDVWITALVLYTILVPLTCLNFAFASVCQDARSNKDTREKTHAGAVTLLAWMRLYMCSSKPGLYGPKRLDFKGFFLCWSQTVKSRNPWRQRGRRCSPRNALLFKDSRTVRTHIHSLLIRRSFRGDVRGADLGVLPRVALLNLMRIRWQ